NHPVVVAAPRSQIAFVWLLCTLGLVAFGAGAALAKKLVPEGRVYDVHLSRLGTATLYYGCIAAAFLLAIFHVSSGLLINVAQLYLFGIAFASYQSAAKGRPFGMELLATVAACVLAIQFGAKEYAVLPVAAWAVGHFAPRRRFLTWGAVAVGMLGVVFYIGVQSQRAATALGDDRQDFLGATLYGLRAYDYPTGLRRHKTGIQIPLNAVAGITSRVRGADSLFVFAARIPERDDFKHGRTLWQPAISIVPGAGHFLDLEFPQLSLGRYFNQTFWSSRPGQDPSAQAPTVPGDLYLNFGTAGVVVGLVSLGFIYGTIDRRAPVHSATSAGLFAYAAIQLLSIDRNVAYLLVTGAIRYALGLLLIAMLRHAVLHRSRVPRPADGARSGPPLQPSPTSF
ncbi:MAG: hypothetical protein M3290_11405, partial [Actinomycetota bacterium]|nr:hypothetical protein [Actinomycetota bacterium]